MKGGCQASLRLCLVCSLWWAGSANQQSEGQATEESVWPIPGLKTLQNHLAQTTYVMVSHAAIPKDDDFIKLMNRLERGVTKAENAWYQRGESGIFSLRSYVTSTTLNIYKAWRGSGGEGSLLCAEIHRATGYLYQGWHDEMAEAVAAEWRKDFPDGAVQVSDTEKCPPNFVIDVVESGEPRVKGLWVETLESHRERPVYTSHEHPTLKMEWSQTRGAWRIYDEDAYQLFVPGLARKTLYINEADTAMPPENGWHADSPSEKDGLKPEGPEPWPKLVRLDVPEEEDPEDVPVYRWWGGM